jgi:hypothetical protein
MRCDNVQHGIYCNQSAIYTIHINAELAVYRTLVDPFKDSTNGITYNVYNVCTTHCDSINRYVKALSPEISNSILGIITKITISQKNFTRKS